MTDKVPKTIIEQLGHQKFIAMVGAKDFAHTPTTLTFRFSAKARNLANRCKIALMDNDTYTVTFYRYRNYALATVSIHSDVQAAELARIFADETGLHTKL